MELTIGDYRLEISQDSTYSFHSTDNTVEYDSIYLNSSGEYYSTLFGIKLFVGDDIFKSALIGSTGGGTGLHKTSYIREADKILICCSNSVFCLSIPDLSLLWKTNADMATCFEIFAYKTDYIIHGELEITRLGHGGKIMWQKSGADIFTALNSQHDDFLITEDYILATDWESRKYKFDFDGNMIQ